jgi:N6-adenosine-specific RNA methylase IME4
VSQFNDHYSVLNPEQSQCRPAESPVAEADDLEVPDQVDAEPTAAVVTTERRPLEEIPSHAVADVFPMLPEAELKRLAANIKENKQHEPIVMYENKILDGRNRYRACLLAGVTPLFENYAGDDPVGYVISRNLMRRHMDVRERAVAAAKLATVTDGGDRRSDQDAILHLDRSQWAERFGISERSIASAAKALADGHPDLFRALDQGKISLSTAEKATTLAPDEQREVANLALAGEKKAARTAIDSKAPKPGNGRTALCGAYSVVLVDLQRSFLEHSAPAADDPYPDLPLKKLKDTISLQAAPDSVVLAWTTPPRLAQTIEAVRSKGFCYRSHCVWPTDTEKTGCWFLNKHALLVLFTRGNPPEPKAPWPSLIEAPAADGSSKPDEFFQMIEESYRGLRKIELDRQGPSREGWD